MSEKSAPVFQPERDHWLRVKEILASALELPEQDRPAFLERECVDDTDLRNEVEALLQYSNDVDGFIEKPAIADGVALLDRTDVDSTIGRQLGAFRVVEFLGEGGSSTVYRAVREQGDFEQQAAIKILKRGMDSDAVLRRFREERRILARLDHPNIARLLDAGLADDGRPYFVMEYLEGTPIHLYCREHSLTVRQRVELFVPICSAVEYSHKNLVIHRDLKASNILVTDAGVPKLLDFGIAKLLDGHSTGSGSDMTQPADRMLTPDYASPEQISGEAITTSSDVYSLGVLLYEVLADRRPFHFAGLSSGEMLRKLHGNEPAKPSEVAPNARKDLLKGDLDTIVCKSLNRVPDRRYASPEQLGDDLRRYLDGQAVLARPDSVTYRLRKFVLRNQASVAVASLSLIVLVAGALTTVWQTAAASSREREFRLRSAELRDLTNGLLGDLDEALDNLPGATGAREILARRVLKYVDGIARENSRDGVLRNDVAVAYERLGDILGGGKHSHLGDSQGALECYRKELAILEQIPDARPDDPSVRQRASAHSRISDVLAITGKHAEALEEERRALAIRTAWLQAKPGDMDASRAVALSYSEMASDLDRLGRFGEALANRQRVLSILKPLASDPRAGTNFQGQLAIAYKRLGKSLMLLKRFDEASASLRDAVRVERRLVAAEPQGTTARFALSFSLTDLGVAFRSAGDLKRALEALNEALSIREQLAAADPRDWRAASLLATTRLQLGLTLQKAGNTAPAITQIRAALESRRKLAERNPKNTGARGEVAEAEIGLADVLSGSHQSPNEANQLYRDGLAIYEDLQSRGSLTGELGSEPKRIRSILGTRSPNEPI